MRLKRCEWERERAKTGKKLIKFHNFTLFEKYFMFIEFFYYQFIKKKLIKEKIGSLRKSDFHQPCYLSIKVLRKQKRNYIAKGFSSLSNFSLYIKEDLN